MLIKHCDIITHSRADFEGGLAKFPLTLGSLHPMETLAVTSCPRRDLSLSPTVKGLSQCQIQFRVVLASNGHRMLFGLTKTSFDKINPTKLLYFCQSTTEVCYSVALTLWRLTYSHVTFFQASFPSLNI